jgi:RimJ/RimL family protein N-acetyltransferase
MVQSDTTPISLRPVLPADLDVFFLQQLDPDAIRMAAFTPKDPSDRAYFEAHWAKILADPTLTVRTILYEGQIAGNIACHSWFGSPEVCYWLGRDFWGKGIATRALAAFLELLPTRPLTARAAKDNLASLRALEKCGFQVVGSDRGFANGRGEEVEELIMELKA